MHDIVPEALALRDTCPLTFSEVFSASMLTDK